MKWLDILKIVAVVVGAVLAAFGAEPAARFAGGLVAPPARGAVVDKAVHVQSALLSRTPSPTRC